MKRGVIVGRSVGGWYISGGVVDNVVKTYKTHDLWM